MSPILLRWGVEPQPAALALHDLRATLRSVGVRQVEDRRTGAAAQVADDVFPRRGDRWLRHAIGGPATA